MLILIVQANPYCGELDWALQVKLESYELSSFGKKGWLAIKKIAVQLQANRLPLNCYPNNFP
jgi:hypothetical protein